MCYICAMFIILCGLPGVGKSTVAQAIEQTLAEQHPQRGWVLLRADVLRREIFATRTYSAAETDAIYGELVSRALALLQSSDAPGRPAAPAPVAILDATFTDAALRRRVIHAAEAAGISWLLLHIVADRASVRQRLATRTGDASEADFAVYLQKLAAFQPLTEPHIVIDNSGGHAALMGQVAEALTQFLTHR